MALPLPLCSQYPDVYVASVSLEANYNQVRALARKIAAATGTACHVHRAPAAGLLLRIGGSHLPSSLSLQVGSPVHRSPAPLPHNSFAGGQGAG